MAMASENLWGEEGLIETVMMFCYCGSLCGLIETVMMFCYCRDVWGELVLLYCRSRRNRCCRVVLQVTEELMLSCCIPGTHDIVHSSVTHGGMDDVVRTTQGYCCNPITRREAHHAGPSREDTSNFLMHVHESFLASTNPSFLEATSFAPTLARPGPAYEHRTINKK